jgi:hypothetical protein
MKTWLFDVIMFGNWIMFFCLIAAAVVSFKKILKDYKSIQYYVVLAVAIIAAFNMFGFSWSVWVDGVNLSSRRYDCVTNLKRFYRLQKDFYKANGHYANSFEELKASASSDYRSQANCYTYYLSNSRIDVQRGVSAPLRTKPLNDRIYAICFLGSKLGYDEISIDYNGKLKLLHSFDFWPLPRPE